MTSGGESERLFEAWRRQARGGTPLGNVTGHHLPQDKRLRHRVTPLSFSAPKALANNHHRDAPCPSSFAPTRSGQPKVDVVLAPQPIATTRRAADRFPIRTVSSPRQTGCQVSANQAERPREYPTCRQLFAALLVLLEILGQSPG
jgi:hypothetical protein